MFNPLRSQFGKPSGLFGSLFMGPLLNIANMRLVNAAIARLNPSPQDKILDVGFGGGYSLFSLAGLARRGKVEGVDYSLEMVERASAEIHQRRLASRIRVTCADVAALPYPGEAFDKALTASSIYYWQDPSAGLREMARVLKPGGRISVGIRSPASLRLLTLAWQDFRLYEREELEQMMEAAGFRILSSENWEWWRIPDLVVVAGEKPTKKEPTDDNHGSAV